MDAQAAQDILSELVTYSLIDYTSVGWMSSVASRSVYTIHDLAAVFAENRLGQAKAGALRQSWLLREMIAMGKAQRRYEENSKNVAQVEALVAQALGTRQPGDPATLTGKTFEEGLRSAVEVPALERSEKPQDGHPILNHSLKKYAGVAYEDQVSDMPGKLFDPFPTLVWHIFPWIRLIDASSPAAAVMSTHATEA